jgi:F0F1-type ATP synthase assembly protein I
MGVLSYLFGGVLVYGGLGYLGWHYLDQVWMVPIGVLVGIGLAFVLIIRRYARSDVIEAEVEQMIAERDRKRAFWAAEARKPRGSA